MRGVKLFGTDSKLEKADFQLEKWKKFTKNNGKGGEKEGGNGGEGKKGEGKDNKLIKKYK